MLRIALGLLFTLLLLSPTALAEKRVALIIGNGKYGHQAALPNVPNDAVAIAALFKSANFDAVDVRYNLDAAGLRRALRDFAGRAADADVAVVFYAGHGIEVSRVNYLIPVDARLVSDFDVEDEAVSLDRVLQATEPAKRLRLVILDACRENPFVSRMKRTAAARSVGRGLGRVEPPSTNTLIAYATKPYDIAEDGPGPNSPFTAALVKHLTTPGLDLRIALGYVRDDVLANTRNRQEPYITGSLGGGVVSIASDAPKLILKKKGAHRPVAEAAAHYKRGQVHSFEGDDDLAIVEFTKAIEIDPRYADAYNSRGGNYHSKGDYDRAIADSTQAIEINPEYAEAYNSRGRHYHSKGDYGRAIADFARAIEIDQRHDAYNGRGEGYLGKGDYDRAITDFTRAIEIQRAIEPNMDKGYTVAYYNRGRAYHAKGDYDRAIADFTKALEPNYHQIAKLFADMPPHWTQAVRDLTGKTHHARGLAYEARGRRADAIKDYRSALDFGHRPSREALKRLGSQP
jgi:tetratricopeptide (TPR) repeat protein